MEEQILIPLWGAWQTMNRLHISYRQYEDDPYAEGLIFEAFAAGEAVAENAIQQAAQAAA